MRPTLKVVFAALGAGLFAVGCAGAPRPDDQLVASEASVRTAQEIGAQHIPSAALELQLAEDELQHAKDFIRNGDNDKAKRELVKSKADSDLALSLTKREHALAEADTAQTNLKALNAPAHQ